MPNPALRASAHPVDVSSLEQMTRFAGEVIDQHGAVDIVINNAGVGFAPRPFEELSDELYHQVMDTNLWGAYHGARLFLPHLKTRPEASLVCVSSLAGLVGIWGYAPYAMSKFAMTAMAEELIMEFAGTPLHIMAVHPGGIKTDLMKNALNLTTAQRIVAHEFFTRFALLTPETAAARILSGIRHRRRRIILGADAHVIRLIVSLFPNQYPAILRAIFSRIPFQ